MMNVFGTVIRVLRQRWMWSLLLRPASITIAMFSLTSCSWIAMAAKESALSATGRSGWDSFTFAGNLPAHFGLDVKPSYDPIDPQSSVCQRQNLYGEWNPRYYGTTHTVPIQDAAHAFSLKLPLTYSVGLCTMQLTSVDLEINGRYGQQRWQQTYARGGLIIEKALPAGAPEFDSSGALSINGRCDWLFQQSKARARLGEISKLLTCKGAGAYLQYDQLPGKTVTLAIEVNPEEEPYRDDTWIKFPNGWKPCLPKEGWQRCQKPPVFKTFQMNGQTCTVYPGCTE